MACFLLVIFVLLSSTSGSPVYKRNERRKDFYFSPKKVVDFNVHISEAGEEYNEKIEVDPNKQTELFQVPAHPGVDRSDTLHDFRQNLTMLRFPDSKICYLFPLANEQSTPEKLMRDLEKAKQMVITETRRVDTTWIIDGEVTDRSVLSDELADFCAQYPIYHVKEAQQFLEVTGIQTEERAHRMRRQAERAPNDTELCHGGMDLKKAYQICPKPRLKTKEYRSCVKYVECDGRRIGRLSYVPTRVSHDPGCGIVHGYGLIVCYKYVCNSSHRQLSDEGSGSEEGSGEASGDILERL